MKDREAVRKGKRILVQKASNMGTSSVCFKNRCLTVQKKASQLSTLCNVDVCVICYERDRLLFTWPEDRTAAREIAMKFKLLDDKTKSKRTVNLAGFSKKIKEDEEKKSGGNGSKFPSWDKSLDECSKEKLMELENFLLSKIQKLEERCELLKQQKEEQEKEIKLEESGREDELVSQLAPPATDDQNHNLSELTGNNIISTLVGEFDSDFDAWFHECFSQEGSSSNINPNSQFQNQGFYYPDMNGNNIISNVNSLVPVDQIAVNGGFMVPQGYNNYSQSFLPQTHYQDLSAQMIGTSSSYNHLHQVHMQNSRISCNNNIVPMGTVEDS